MRSGFAKHSLASLLCVLLVGASARLCSAQAADADPYTWLEDVYGAKAMDWVNAENDRSAKILQADPRFGELKSTALELLNSPSRLASPEFRNGTIYNTWQDGAHARGLLRKTTLTDYLTANPHWQTVLDYDALALRDGHRWTHGAIATLYPDSRESMVGLSEGGEDAETYREFDLKTGQFVPNGFVLPRSKQTVTWLDHNNLLVARDWGAGTMTKSGYPFVIKLWHRGEPLDAAKELFRGNQDDVATSPVVRFDGQGHRLVTFERGLNFFEQEFSIWSPKGLSRLAIPSKSQIAGLLQNRMIVQLNQDWTPDGVRAPIPQGSVVSLDLSEVNRDSTHLKPTIVFSPTDREFVEGVGLTKGAMILTTLENVQGRAYTCRFDGKNGWTRKRLPVPDNEAVSIQTTNQADDRFFLSVSGFLTPPSLWLGNAASGTLDSVKTAPAQFDASPFTVDQQEATSKDGTHVPYFVVHRKDMPLNGSNPTLIDAYGGFRVSSTPFYSASIGKLWLERGGVFVLANIRGGGEFGPAWHEAGLKTHRQRIYDDFYAVAQDLVARNITSPQKLGIEGGSNGGLLMGVEMTQHPEMWKAVVIQVPLLDMLGFEHIAAGASWVGEYGSVSVPAERDFLASISPYNQLKPNVQYPEPLIFTTTKDDRVGPVHARKFAARMEEYHEPFFYEEITEGGHSSGANAEERATTLATQFVYLARKLMN